MNLIYVCVFHQEGYINLLKLLMRSISVKTNINKETTDILILTSPSFQPLIQKELCSFDLPLQYYILEIHTLFEAGCARLNIFKYANINKYDNILYLDTDILLNSDVNVLFNLEISSEKIYALQEGSIEYDHWGSHFFDFTKYDIKTPAFTSGILFFKNSACMKTLFDTIQSHIEDYIYNKKNPVPACLDQPFIVYNAISQNKYDNQVLTKYVENNPSAVSPEKIIYHFPGAPGSHGSKNSKMMSFWNKMIQYDKIKICQYGTDGFGHQLEGMLRLISLSLNDKAEYIYDIRKSFVFEHSNFDVNKLNSYILKAFDILSKKSINKSQKYTTNKVIRNENRSFAEIIKKDNYSKNIYCYDGVGSGQALPSNFEDITDLKKSLPKLREAFVLENNFLPEPTYKKTGMNIACHIRLGDAVGTRILDNDNVINHIKKLQKEDKNHITIHSDGDVDFLQADNTTLCGRNTDVLQILSDFIHADILIINYSGLSIAAHLLANDDQKVFCPNVAGPTFFKRILDKCNKISQPEIDLKYNKKYSWENHSITFLGNGLMDAFGKGTYTQQNIYTFEAKFGGRIHSLVFNNEYTEFTSTRRDDGYIVKGKLL